MNLGRQPNYTNNPYQLLSGDGSSTAFVLDYSIPGSGAIDVIISGSSKTPGVDYNASGIGLSFTSAPPSGTNNIVVRYNGLIGVSGVPGDQTVTEAKLDPTLLAEIKDTTGYTVATLPVGVRGNRTYVIDATSPTFLGALTGGGTVVCPVFYNGTAWVAG